MDGGACSGWIRGEQGLSLGAKRGDDNLESCMPSTFSPRSCCRSPRCTPRRFWQRCHRFRAHKGRTRAGLPRTNEGQPLRLTATPLSRVKRQKLKPVCRVGTQITIFRLRTRTATPLRTHRTRPELKLDESLPGNVPAIPPDSSILICVLQPRAFEPPLRPHQPTRKISC